MNAASSKAPAIRAPKAKAIIPRGSVAIKGHVKRSSDF